MGRLTEWDGSGLANGDTTDENGGIVTLELTLEKPVEFGILRSLLAVLHALRGRLKKKS